MSERGPSCTRSAPTAPTTSSAASHSASTWSSADMTTARIPITGGGDPAAQRGMSGVFARLGGWTADHRRVVFGAWLALVLALGGLAPFAEHALSGAGWEASNSESLRARDRVQA